MARTGASLALLLMFACHMGAQLLYLWARATVHVDAPYQLCAFSSVPQTDMMSVEYARSRTRISDSQLACPSPVARTPIRLPTQQASVSSRVSLSAGGQHVDG